MDLFFVNELHGKFPIIFRTKEPLWCENGWYDLIYTLCQELETIALSQKAPASQTWFQQKCFDLFSRIDLELKYIPVKIIDWCMPEQDSRLLVVQIKQKFGGLRFYTVNHTDEVLQLITAAEDKSFTICEMCGQPGKTYSIRYWLTSLCEHHYTEKAAGSLGSKSKN